MFYLFHLNKRNSVTLSGKLVSLNLDYSFATPTFMIQLSPTASISINQREISFDPDSRETVSD